MWNRDDNVHVWVLVTLLFSWMEATVATPQLTCRKTFDMLARKVRQVSTTSDKAVYFSVDDVVSSEFAELSECCITSVIEGQKHFRGICNGERYNSMSGLTCGGSGVPSLSSTAF